MISRRIRKLYTNKTYSLLQSLIATYKTLTIQIVCMAFHVMPEAFTKAKINGVIDYISGYQRYTFETEAVEKQISIFHEHNFTEEI
jgi:hypothetical protein